MPRSRPRLFVLSPATLGGARGRALLAGASTAPFAPQLARGAAVPIGDVFSFISSLYYRGKRVYARAFGRRAGGGSAVHVITPTLGLLPDETPVDLGRLGDFASTDIDPADPRYLEPLLASAARLLRAIEPEAQVVLLGSIATGKYLDPLADVLGARLLVPRDFAGRGDMSRGGLLLRAVAAGMELSYVPGIEAARRGRRPPRLGSGTLPPGSPGAG